MRAKLESLVNLRDWRCSQENLSFFEVIKLYENALSNLQSISEMLRTKIKSHRWSERWLWPGMELVGIERALRVTRNIANELELRIRNLKTNAPASTSKISVYQTLGQYGLALSTVQEEMRKFELIRQVKESMLHKQIFASRERIAKARNSAFLKLNQSLNDIREEIRSQLRLLISNTEKSIQAVNAEKEKLGL